MAINGLPDLSFTNNLGTISVKRCMIATVDNFRWNGQSVVRTKAITVSGYVKRAATVLDSEGFESILTNSGSALTRGTMGQLTLPWTVLQNVKLGEIHYATGTWIDYQQVEITFMDDRIDQNKNMYTLNFFGFELHNPRISIPVPNRKLKDEYPQLPWFQGSIPPANYDTALWVIRTKSGYEMMAVQLTGTINLDGSVFPDSLLDVLAHRSTAAIQTSDGGIDNNIPWGYPQPFNLYDACPQLQNNLPMTGMIIIGSRAVWEVEKGSVNVTVDMICQPQKISINTTEG